MSKTEKIEASLVEQLVTPDDYEVFDKHDDVTLAQWNCLMNRWGWPDELTSEPNDKDLPSSEWKANGRRSQLMQVIEERVGGRLISWEWNKERMTEDEFNDFYSGTYEGDKDAKARYEERLREKYDIEV